MVHPASSFLLAIAEQKAHGGCIARRSKARRQWRLRETCAPAYRRRELVMNRNIAILAFTASALGLFCIFDVVPGVGSFLGSVMLVIGGSVLICQAIIAEGAASR